MICLFSSLLSHLSSQPTRSPSSTPSKGPSTSPSTSPAFVVASGTDLPIVTNGIELPTQFVNAAPAIVTLPVERSGCSVDNVVIALGIDYTAAGRLIMNLNSPDGTGVILVASAQGDGSPGGNDVSNLVSANPITFDDSSTNINPQLLGDGGNTFFDIPAGTYNAQGNGNDPNDVYPNSDGLTKFFGLDAEGVWTLDVVDVFSSGTGTVRSVDLTITCRRPIVTNGIGLPTQFVNAAPAIVTLPVERSGCSVDNVVIALGIDYTAAGRLIMNLNSPDGTGVILVASAQGDGSPGGNDVSNLVSANPITFDDSSTNINPQLLGDGGNTFFDIPAGTYNAQGNGNDPNDVYPNSDGLTKFFGLDAEGVWTLDVVDVFSSGTGTVQSVDLTITCLENSPSSRVSNLLMY